MLCPRDSWLARLAEAWRLPLVVEPCGGHHGHYSVLLTRTDEPGSTTDPNPKGPEAMTTATLTLTTNRLELSKRSFARPRSRRRARSTPRRRSFACRIKGYRTSAASTPPICRRTGCLSAAPATFMNCVPVGLRRLSSRRAISPAYWCRWTPIRWWWPISARRSCEKNDSAWLAPRPGHATRR